MAGMYTLFRSVIGVPGQTTIMPFMKAFMTELAERSALAIRACKARVQRERVTISPYLIMIHVSEDRQATTMLVRGSCLAHGTAQSDEASRDRPRAARLQSARRASAAKFTHHGAPK